MVLGVQCRWPLLNFKIGCSPRWSRRRCWCLTFSGLLLEEFNPWEDQLRQWLLGAQQEAQAMWMTMYGLMIAKYFTHPSVICGKSKQCQLRCQTRQYFKVESLIRLYYWPTYINCGKGSGNRIIQWQKSSSKLHTKFPLWIFIGLLTCPLTMLRHGVCGVIIRQHKHCSLSMDLSKVKSNMELGCHHFGGNA